MADLTWPSDLGSATVTGRVLYMEGDSSDPDRDPDVRPAAGTITLEPSVRDLRYDGVDGSILFVKRLTKGVIDAGGYVCTLGPDDTAGEQGLIVPATDSDALTPTDFTYEVNITVGSYRTSFSIKAPSGATVDLASVAPVPPSGGTAIVIDPATAERAETAATRAEAAAVEAEGYAPTFEWTGTELSIDGAAGVDLEGPPGPTVEGIGDVPGLQAIIDRLTVGTGWRNIPGLSPEGVLDPASKSQIKRVGSTVYLQGNGNPGPALADRTLRLPGLLLELPTGFWASGYAPARGTFSVGYGTHQGILHTFVGKNQIRLAFPSPPDTKIDGYLNWSVEFDTNDPWPATLPGTPA